MTRRIYSNPPVHEVILDLQFAVDADPEALEALPGVASDALGPASRLNSFAFRGGFSTTGPLPIDLHLQQDGWEFHRNDPTWIVRAQPQRFTIHSVRSQNWPRGEYIGWEHVAAYLASVHEVVDPLYGQLGVRRAGLRYINRIAVNEGAELERLFNMVPAGPSRVKNLYGFSTQQSWGEFEGAEGFSSTIRFGTIPIPENELEAGGVGLLLDIDVFNLYVETAPEWNECRQWFEDAHDVENHLFEDIITDDLRTTFNLEEGQP